LGPDLVRLPDVAFIAYDRIPAGAAPDVKVPTWVPNLAVEIISEGNTAGEMERKRTEYFAAGVQLSWMVDPPERTVTVYTSVDRSDTIGEDGELDGGDILPGFRLSVREWFERANKLAP
jgi:Uma2 family endonuclease